MTKIKKKSCLYASIAYMKVAFKRFMTNLYEKLPNKFIKTVACTRMLLLRDLRISGFLCNGIYESKAE